MRLLLIALFCVLPIVAQDVVVNVPITVDAAFRDVVTAWINVQCSETGAGGACISRPYANAQDLIRKAAQREVNRIITAIIEWGVTNDPGTLPTSLRNVLATRDAAESTIADIKEAAVQ